MAAAAEERLVVALEARIRDFEKNMSRAKKVANDNLNGIEKRVQNSATEMQRSLKTVSEGAASLSMKLLALGGISLGAREVIAFSDAWVRATNSLKVAGLNGSELNTVMGQLFQAAQRQGVPLEALTTLYGRAAQSAKELGATRQELVQFSEDVATALRVAGTSPEQASGALLQLSQLLGSARVQAEEFNSINEGARPILQAVANGIEEAGGSVSKLKTLVTAGEISNVAFFKGFQAGAEGMRAQAADASDTVASAFTRVSNALTKAIGEISTTTGAAQNAVDGLKAVAAAIELIPNAIARATNAFGDLQNYLNSVGNNPFWKKLGEMLGVKYTDAEAAANGLVLGSPREQGLAALRAGKGTPMKDTFNVSDLATPAKPTKTIRAADYPVIGGKEKKAGAERVGEFDREVASLNKHTEALRLDAEMAGRSTQELSQARATLALLTAARQEGLEVTPALRAQIEAEAAAYGQAAQAAENAQQKIQNMYELQQEFGGLAIDGIEGLMDRTKSLNDVLSDTLKSLSRMALQAALLNTGPLSNLFGDGSKGGNKGGLIGALSAGFGKMFGFADGGVMTPGGPRRLRRYAGGGVSRTAAIFGEAGPEAAVPLPDGRRIPVDLGFGKGAGAIGSPNVTFSPTISIDARGSDITEEQIRAIVKQANRQVLAKVPSLAVNSVVTAQRSNVMGIRK